MSSTRFSTIKGSDTDISTTIQEAVNSYAQEINHEQDNHEQDELHDQPQTYSLLIVSKNKDRFIKLAGGLEPAFIPSLSQLQYNTSHDALVIDLNNNETISNLEAISHLETISHLEIDLQKLQLPVIAILPEANIKQEKQLFEYGISDYLLTSELTTTNLKRCIFKAIERSKQIFNKEAIRSQAIKSQAIESQAIESQAIESQVVEPQVVLSDKSNSFIKQLIDADQNMISLKDLSGKYVYVNQALADYYNLKPEDVIAKTDLELSTLTGQENALLFNKNDKQILEMALTQQISSHTFPNQTIVNLAGQTHTFKTTKHIIYNQAGSNQTGSNKTGSNQAGSNQAGQAHYILTSSEDITLSQQIDYELQQTSTIVENSPIIVFRWTSPVLKTVNFSHVSKNIKLFGYSAEEIKNDGQIWVNKMCHPDDYPQVEAAIAKAMANNEDKVILHYRIYTKQGELRWIKFHVLLERDETKRVKYFQGFLEDITERKNTELELQSLVAQSQESQSFLKEVLDQLPNPVFIKDEKLRYITYNKAFQTMLVGDGNWIDNTITDFTKNERNNSTALHQKQQQALKNKSSYVQEHTLTSTDNKELDVLTSIASFDFDHKNKQGLIGVIQDISKLKTIERKLAKSLEGQETITYRLELLNQLSIDLSNATHLEAVLEIVCKQTKVIIKTDRVSVALTTSSPERKYLGVNQKSIKRLTS